MRNIESWQIDKLHIKILSAGPRQLGSIRRLRSPSAGYHSRVSASSLEGETKPSVSVRGTLKETLILVKSGG